MLLSAIIGCNEESETPYYVYNSEGYNKKIKEFKINIEQASQIFAKYYFEKFPEKKEYYSRLSIVYGDYYVFASKPYNLKIARYNLSGYWVNGMTGDIKEVDTEEYLELILEPNKENKFFRLIKYSDYIN
ncbi:MAG TPA: hypothetical protein VF677_09595 [Flavobacterium sp.]